jgi:multimeric flavodoxin WrbA
MELAEKRGAQTELIRLRDRNVKVCDGCLVCEKTNTCHIKDDMQEIYRQILAADGLIFGTPVYFDVTAQGKIIIDRLLREFKSGPTTASRKSLTGRP